MDIIIYNRSTITLLYLFKNNHLLDTIRFLINIILNFSFKYLF